MVTPVMQWHRDLPPRLEEVFEVVAKALMIRAGDPGVVLSREELQDAADTQTEIALDEEGCVYFRVERN
jgi:hypothetical protein